MTLQQRFNWTRRIQGLVAALVILGAVYWVIDYVGPLDISIHKAEILETVSILGQKIAIFMVIWMVLLPIVFRYTIERCPNCKTHYTYRKPDLDGTENTSNRADNHCHKCDYRFDRAT